MNTCIFHVFTAFNIQLISKPLSFRFCGEFNISTEFTHIKKQYLGDMGLTNVGLKITQIVDNGNKKLKTHTANFDILFPFRRF